MSTQPTTEAVQNGKATKKPPLPPDEKFWKRYSPHHEAPLSGVSSLTLHILFPCVIALGFFLFRERLDKQSQPVPITAIALDAGGGGVPSGVEGGTAAPQEAVAKPEEQINAQTPATPAPVPPDQLQVQPTPTIQINQDDASNDRKIEEINNASQVLSSINQDARRKLMDQLNRPSKGQGGPGVGGGKGPGVGTGEGPGEGPGKASMGSDREKRILRWTIRFNTLNGNDYVRQLAGLGAILAIPEPDGTFRVLRDLTHLPPKGEIEDVGAINRIFWVDNQPDSVRSLGTALRLREMPPYIVAFFPETLEAELLQLERKYANKREDQIKETRYNIMPIGGGKYQPKVSFQR